MSKFRDIVVVIGKVNGSVCPKSKGDSNYIRITFFIQTESFARGKTRKKLIVFVLPP